MARLCLPILLCACLLGGCASDRDSHPPAPPAASETPAGSQPAGREQQLAEARDYLALLRHILADTDDAQLRAGLQRHIDDWQAMLAELQRQD